MRRFGLRYTAQREDLLPRLRDVFLELKYDSQSRAFVQRSVQKPYSKLWCWLRGNLTRYVSRYTADGILGMSRMHVLSTEQWRALLRGRPGCAPAGTLLDVGAGDGGQTKSAAPLFARVTATESSRPLAWSLWWKGFESVRSGDIRSSGLCTRKYDVVACLNLLDRVDDPIALLRDARDAAKDDGRIVLAVVMPFCPAVMAPGGPRPPKHRLPIPGCCDGSVQNSWEDCVNALVSRVLEPIGLRVETLARAPYLSHGDYRQSLYTLDDAVLVLRKCDPVEEKKDESKVDFFDPFVSVQNGKLPQVTCTPCAPKNDAKERQTMR